MGQSDRDRCSSLWSILHFDNERDNVGGGNFEIGHTVEGSRKEEEASSAFLSSSAIMIEQQGNKMQKGEGRISVDGRIHLSTHSPPPPQLWELPDMMSASEGGGGNGKEEVAREGE